MTDDAITVLVLSGGRAMRLGVDKATVVAGDRPLIAHLLDAVPGPVPVVVVGPGAPPDFPNLTVVDEEHPHGGPTSGIAAGLAHVRTPIVVVCAVDMPLALPQALGLAASLAEQPFDGLVPVTADGRRQPLAAAYRTEPLRAAIAALGDPFGRALREVVAALRIREVPALRSEDLVDVDTPDDLAALRDRLSVNPSSAEPEELA